MSTADPVVNLTDSTSLRGFVTFSRDSDKPVYSFRGVPYAAPPVGGLRFKKTEPVKLWEGERVAKTLGAQCVQQALPDGMFPFKTPQPVDTSEDCLLLNIQTPSVDQHKKLPVMVSIHGGGYVGGAGDWFDGTQLCTFHDVVVVSINYRVHSLGFLCSYDGVIPGNMGLYDQIESLKWVQKYITKFGGDPGNVTIMGESAGGISVSLLMLTKLSKGLFHKAISQSGCCFVPTYLQTPEAHQDRQTKFLKELGYEGNSTSELLTFLDTVPKDTFYSKSGRVQWRPVIDGVMFEKPAEELYSSGQVHRVPWLVGCNTHEGLISMLFLEMTGKVKDENSAKEKLKWLVMVHDYNEEWTNSALDEALQLYMKDKEGNDSASYYRAATEICGDFLLDYPQDVALQYHKQYSDCYMYQFNHRAKFADKTTFPPWAVADHAWEINFVFGFPFAQEPNAEYNEDDEAVSRSMIDLWCNFAKTGVPTAENVSWPKYNDQEEYLNITTTPAVCSQFKDEIMAFWRKWHQKDCFVKYDK